MALAQSHVAAEHNKEDVHVIIQHQLMVDPPVSARQVRVEYARNNHAQVQHLSNTKLNIYVCYCIYRKCHKYTLA